MFGCFELFLTFIKQLNATKMKKLWQLAVIGTLIGTVSCTKRDEVFTRVTVGQTGELITARGFLKEKKAVDWGYSIRIWVKETGWTDYMIKIKAGETTGFRDFQSSAKFGEWKITYDGPFKQ